MTSMLIARDGHEFELPLDHLIRFYRGGDGRAGYVVIDAPEQGGSLFRVREVEERLGAIVVHLADEVATVGPSRWRRDPVSQTNGIPRPLSGKPGSLKAARHRRAAQTHDKATRRHEEAASYWAKRGNSAYADLERRNVAIERAAARLERDRADLEEQDAVTS